MTRYTNEEMLIPGAATAKVNMEHERQQAMLVAKEAGYDSVDAYLADLSLDDINAAEEARCA